MDDVSSKIQEIRQRFHLGASLTNADYRLYIEHGKKVMSFLQGAQEYSLVWFDLDKDVSTMMRYLSERLKSQVDYTREGVKISAITGDPIDQS